MGRRGLTVFAVLVGVLLAGWWILSRPPSDGIAVSERPPAVVASATPVATRSPAPIPLTLPSGRSAPGRVDQTVVSVRCVSGRAGDETFCDRWNRDRRGRRLLTNTDAVAIQVQVPVITGTFEDAVRPCRLSALQCVDEGRRALVADGFHDAQVRPVGREDPLPLAVWAVAAGVGPGCIVAGWDPVGDRWTGAPDVLGPRVDDGRCLSP